VNKCTTINYVGRLKEGTGLGPTDRGLYTIYLNRSINMLGQPYRGVKMFKQHNNQSIQEMFKQNNNQSIQEMFKQNNNQSIQEMFKQNNSQSI
jgi:hypothetical protein